MKYAAEHCNIVHGELSLLVTCFRRTKCYRPQPTRRTSWKLGGNPGCQPGLATSFQLVRLVDCGLYAVSFHTSNMHE